ncbi:MAG: hypothetical protein JXA93_03250 [Anaerolineae bacterium]|nr:hypothetical protein [Anaerolineae bacterium]
MKLRLSAFSSHLRTLLQERATRGALLACAFLIFGGGAYGFKTNYTPGPLSAVSYRGEPINGYESHAAFEKDCRHCHAPVRCLSANLCQDCHKEIARERADSTGLHGLLPGTAKCQNCHSEHAGRDAMISAVPFVNVDHEQLTGFSLARHQHDYEGAPLGCQQCHTDGRYVSDPVACAPCHEDYDPAFLDAHTASFGSGCVVCHDGRDRMIDLDHDAVYVLDGAHLGLECAACHGGPPPDTPRTCVACHEDPAAHAGSFGLDCVRCHTTTAWLPAELREHVFELDHGSEELVACETCHVDSYVAYTCYGCHDHEAGDMRDVHAAEDIWDMDPCAGCHPTGELGDATEAYQGASAPAWHTDNSGEQQLAALSPRRILR